MYSQMPREVGSSLLGFLLAPLQQPDLAWQSLPFAATLMAILLSHEMGHYLTARRLGIEQSLPYFLPAPTLFGTFGAVIVMQSTPTTRRDLLKVAVMGPYAGLLVALPAAAWGLCHSTPIPSDLWSGAASAGAQMQGGLEFGESLLFGLLERLFSPNGGDILLHPVATAAWVGLFITSLNLIPAAQLDGGHVTYALFGHAHRQISQAVVVGMVCFGVHSACLGEASGMGDGGAMWLVWAVLLLLMGLRHPPVQNESLKLSPAQRLNGALALLLFAITFTPVPLRLVEAGPVFSVQGDLSNGDAAQDDDFERSVPPQGPAADDEEDDESCPMWPDGQQPEECDPDGLEQDDDAPEQPFAGQISL
jgi:membrane-associated protease RseP (regulator of RpoE activity)